MQQVDNERHSGNPFAHKGKPAGWVAQFERPPIHSTHIRVDTLSDSREAMDGDLKRCDSDADLDDE